MRPFAVKHLPETSVRPMQRCRRCRRQHISLYPFLLSFFPSFLGENLFFSRCVLFRALIVETQAGQTADRRRTDGGARDPGLVSPAALPSGPVRRSIPSAVCLKSCALFACLATVRASSAAGPALTSAGCEDAAPLRLLQTQH